jgi:alkyldihydroxyacetonephosphate synthase
MAREVPSSGPGRDNPPQLRRLGGWGFEGECYPPSAPLLAWLEERIGRSSPFPTLEESRAATPSPRRVPELDAALSQEDETRLRHARGQGLTDLIRVRSGTQPALPDAVVRPGDAAEVEQVLQRCAGDGVRVIPWGGGTSVTGAVNVLPGRDTTISLDLGRLVGLEQLDEESGVARFGAGTLGPQIEASLAERGFTLGHFPQSFELSSLGGWIASRASGQESLGYGSIQDLVAGLDLVAPAGRLELPSLPATAAGPDLRQLVTGSEGRLGIVTHASVRVRRRPERTLVEAALLPGWLRGLEAARDLLQQGVPLTLLRLSDEPETEVAMTLGLSRHSRAAPFVRGWLRLRGVAERACLVLYGAAGDRDATRDGLGLARALLGRHGGVSLGASPGRRWLADRFRHPYLRDALLDIGIATDTLETAAHWSRLPDLAARVRGALEAALEPEGERTAVLCHVSHPYRDGASLYFTFFFRVPRDPDAAVKRWAVLKRRATAAILEAGGTLSHHHGVGAWHAPWLQREIGERGVGILRAAAATLDPNGILNPNVLLDAEDRLEV